MSTIGDDLLRPASPAVRAGHRSRRRLQQQSAGRGAGVGEGGAGFAREDLFTVVLEQFQTDTADYADYVLPATTQLEHWDIHGAYGHTDVLLNRPAVAPLGEARPNTEVFRELARRMGFDEPCFRRRR
jgi:anaerobic selenocysteine-containing dehydrogenase